MSDPMDAALDKVLNDAAPAASQPTQQQATSPTTPKETSAPAGSPQPAASAPEDWKVRAKFDHDEKDIDFMEWAREQRAKGRLKEVVERDYGFDRRITRAQQETQQAADAAYREWLDKNNFDIVQDSNAHRGWKPVPRQAAKPAEVPADPLAIEEKQLRDKINAAETVDPNDLIRLQEILADRRAKTAEESVFKRINQERETVTRVQREKEATENGMKWLRGEIGKKIEAHAKSFEGPDAERRKARIAALAEQRFLTPGAKIEDALAVVTEEALDLDSRRDYFTKSLTQDPRPTPPPTVGGSPGGPQGKPSKGRPTEKDIDAALDAAWEIAARG